MSMEMQHARFWRTPLDATRIATVRGEVGIIEERCKGCAFCVEYCPRHVLVLSKRFNRKGYHPPEIAESGACVHCNLCEMICPEFAIFSWEVSTPAAAGTGGEVQP